MKRVMSTEVESPFKDFHPKLNQTSAFILRFFEGWSYDDIARKFDVPKEKAYNYVNKATACIMEIIEMLDTPKESPKVKKWLKTRKVFGFQFKVDKGN